MENRFGFRDLVLCFLLVVLIISVWWGIKAQDRQYQLIRGIHQTLNANTGTLTEIQRSLSARPVAAAVPAVPALAVEATGGSATQPAANGGGAIEPAAATTQTAVPPPERMGEHDPFARLRLARAQPEFAEGGWLIDAFSGGVALLTPLRSGDVYASIIQGAVLETLATRDPDTLEWQGLLASGWQVEDNSKAYREFVDRRKAEGASDEEIANDPQRPVPLRIVFQMRDNVVFSDGVPLTADDVVWTFNWIMNPKVDAPRHRAYLQMIEKVEKTGPSEVTFSYREPYFEAFELAASLEVMPRHFYSRLSEEQFNQSVGHLLGSGAYRLPDPTAWKPGTPIQLVRNERYWGVRPAFDRRVYREITNDVARLTSFRNGDIDIFAASPEQYREMIADASLTARTQHFEYASPIGGYRYIAWNQLRNGKPTAFADPRVRRALTMLVNRQRLIQEVMLGYAVEATGPFNPQSEQYNTEVKPLPYDVRAARELLAEAGFVDRDRDGVLEGPDGKPFRFRLTYPSGSTNYEAMALFLKDAFARGGVVMEPDPLEWSVFTDRLNNKNFEAISLGWSAGIETDIYQMFHSTQAIEGGDNFINYKNPELDHIIDQARRTVDEEERMPLWRRAHAIMHEDQPYTFLFFPMSLRFLDNRVRNVEKVKLGLNPPEEWYVPRHLQRQGQ